MKRTRQCRRKVKCTICSKPMDLDYFLNNHAIKQHLGQTANYEYLEDESGKPKAEPKTLLNNFLRKRTALEKLWAFARYKLLKLLNVSACNVIYHRIHYVGDG